MTVEEAARELGCSQGLVYKLCDLKKLGHMRLGVGRGTIRISPDHLAEYRRSCEVVPLPDGVVVAPEPRSKRARGPVVRDRIAEIERKRRTAKH